MPDTVQGLWIGEELSALELLSIRSFLANGHGYDLYAYRMPRNLPEGAAFRDASAILPESSVFQYTGYASYAGFANFFRYQLLLQKGGWWADTDMVCLRPLDLGADYVFASEADGDRRSIANAILKTPPDSEIMRFTSDICAGKDPTALRWGETGPRLLTEAVQRFRFDSYVVAPEVFCPLSFREWQRVLEPEQEIALPAECRAIHLWNEMWRRNECDKNHTYPPASLYERLKARFAPS